jgi:hypothetical protein
MTSDVPLPELIERLEWCHTIVPPCHQTDDQVLVGMERWVQSAGAVGFNRDSMLTRDPAQRLQQGQWRHVRAQGGGSLGAAPQLCS